MFCRRWCFLKMHAAGELSYGHRDKSHLVGAVGERGVGLEKGGIGAFSL